MQVTPAMSPDSEALIYKVPQSTSPQILIGRLTQQYQDRGCVHPREFDDLSKQARHGKEERWHSPHFEVGFVTVSSDQDLKPFLGQVVAVTGHVTEKVKFNHKRSNWHHRHVHSRDCGYYQMRSDWVDAKEGIRLLRPVPDRLRQVASFRAHRISKYQGLSARRQKNHLVVTLKNTFNQPLKNVSLVASYEECVAKPLTFKKTKTKQNLAPGESLTASFPLVTTKKSDVVNKAVCLKGRMKGRRSRDDNGGYLSSIQVTNDQESILFDWDVEGSFFLGRGWFSEWQKKHHQK